MIKTIRYFLVTANIVLACYQAHKNIVLMLLPNNHKLSEAAIELFSYFLLTIISVAVMLPEIHADFLITKKNDINTALSFAVTALICAAFISFVLRIVGLPMPGNKGVFSVVSVVNGVFLAPIYEEITCRLVIQKGLSRIHPIGAIVITSVLFSSLHFLNKGIVPLERALPTFAVYFVLGAVCGISYWKQKNIVVTSLVHMFWNMFILVSKVFVM